MNIKEAEKICGSLSKPSKMPCFGYSIPAEHCKVGKRMQDVSGSICSVCYALRGNYQFPVVKAGLEKRFQSLKDERWVDAIVALIAKKEKSGYFRWHDSGDLQGIWHLEKIVEVAKRLPNIKFWLPTREYKIVKDYLSVYGAFPSNLTVRLSGLWLDGNFPEKHFNPYNLPVSGAASVNYNCPAHLQGNKCLDCRACWNLNEKEIVYRKH